jgi:hypothetical protein
MSYTHMHTSHVLAFIYIYFFFHFLLLISNHYFIYFILLFYIYIYVCVTNKEANYVHVVSKKKKKVGTDVVCSFGSRSQVRSFPRIGGTIEQAHLFRARMTSKLEMRSEQTRLECELESVD